MPRLVRTAAEEDRYAEDKAILLALLDHYQKDVLFVDYYGGGDDGYICHIKAYTPDGDWVIDSVQDAIAFYPGPSQVVEIDRDVYVDDVTAIFDNHILCYPDDNEGGRAFLVFDRHSRKIRTRVDRTVTEYEIGKDDAS